MDIFVLAQQNPVHNETYEYRYRSSFSTVNHFVRLNDPDRGGVNPWDFHLASGIQGSYMKSRRVISQSEMALKPRNRTASRKKRHE